MKKILITLALLLSLSGCDFLNVRPTPCPPPVVENHYVKQTIPSDHLAIPPQTAKIDLKTSTQKDVARWILDNEKRTTTLEDQIKAIKKLQDERVD